MMKLYSILICSLIAVCCTSIVWCATEVEEPFALDPSIWDYGFQNLDDSWNAFIVKYHKSYNTASLQQQRKDIFALNLAVVANHNKKRKRSYVMALNEFSDLTDDEFNEKMSLGKFYNKVHTTVPIDNTLHSTTLVYRPSFDWREYSCVSPIRNYGDYNCGAGWAFSAAEALEGAWCSARDVLYNLSEQQIIDCTPHTDGCRGGNVALAFRGISEQNGICTDFQYPFEGKKNVCRQDQCKKVAEVLYWAGVPPNNEVAMENALILRGPISVHVNAEKWRHYHNGIFDEDAYGSKFDHNAVVIGFDVAPENNQAYWIVKNSWGTTWGEQGFMRIARGGPYGGRSGVLTTGLYVVPKIPEFL